MAPVPVSALPLAVLMGEIALALFMVFFQKSSICSIFPLVPLVVIPPVAIVISLRPVPVPIVVLRLNRHRRQHCSTKNQTS